MIEYEFDKEKAICSILFICQELGGTWDKYSILKILYFAEKRHISTYGRTITGDKIVALKYGPVPSSSYDIIKDFNLYKDYFEITDESLNNIRAKVLPNMDVFSESDIECLKLAISENIDLPFGKLKDKSHDEAYDWTIANLGEKSAIPYEKIALSGGASNDMIDYIRIISENQLCELNGTF